MALEHCDQGPWCEPASGGAARQRLTWRPGSLAQPCSGCCRSAARRSGSDTGYAGPAPRQASPTRAGASTSLQDWVHTATLRRPRDREGSEEPVSDRCVRLTSSFLVRARACDGLGRWRVGSLGLFVSRGFGWSCLPVESRRCQGLRRRPGLIRRSPRAHGHGLCVKQDQSATLLSISALTQAS